MSNYDINSNPALVKLMIENAKKSAKKYLEEHPNSLIPTFEKELRDIGYEFEVSSQIKGLMPKNKEDLIPIIKRYYKHSIYDNEKWFFASLLSIKGFDEFATILINDFYSEPPPFDRWQIGSCLYDIGSKKHIEDYIKIVSNKEYGITRQMVVLLIGKLKVENAIPILIKLLNDSDVTGHAICALGNYKNEEFRPYFEEFLNQKNKYYRKEAKNALKKLDKKK